MTPEEREQAIIEIKKICREIGCSKLNSQLCDKEPFRCDIIRKLIMEQKGGRDGRPD